MRLPSNMNYLPSHEAPITDPLGRTASAHLSFIFPQVSAAHLPSPVVRSWLLDQLKMGCGSLMLWVAKLEVWKADVPPTRQGMSCLPRHLLQWSLPLGASSDLGAARAGKPAQGESQELELAVTKSRYLICLLQSLKLHPLLCGPRNSNLGSCNFLVYVVQKGERQ